MAIAQCIAIMTKGRSYIVLQYNRGYNSSLRTHCTDHVMRPDYGNCAELSTMLYIVQLVAVYCTMYNAVYCTMYNVLAGSSRLSTVLEVEPPNSAIFKEVECSTVERF